MSSLPIPSESNISLNIVAEENIEGLITENEVSLDKQGNLIEKLPSLPVAIEHIDLNVETDDIVDNVKQEDVMEDIDTLPVEDIQYMEGSQENDVAVDNLKQEHFIEFEIPKNSMIIKDVNRENIDDGDCLSTSNKRFGTKIPVARLKKKNKPRETIRRENNSSRRTRQSKRKKPALEPSIEIPSSPEAIEEQNITPKEKKPQPNTSTQQNFPKFIVPVKGEKNKNQNDSDDEYINLELYKGLIGPNTLLYDPNTRFKCDLCDFMSDKKSKLTAHTAKEHDEPFSCPLCPYKCKPKGNLTKHLLRHNNDKPFACHICSFRFKANGELKRHLLRHAGDKPYSCNVCSYKCVMKYSLKQHLLRHSGFKPFSCHLCPYSCSRKSYFEKHLLKHATGAPLTRKTGKVRKKSGNVGKLTLVRENELLENLGCSLDSQGKILI